jgi:TM2 domain-containing membrane protein YozV
MNVFNEVVRGAAQQFGREFGRAGANAVLKGKNYYAVKNVSDYSGRIKPSDSDVVRAIKEINRIKFVTTNKANTSRLIDATDIALDIVSFKGLETLNQINDIKVFLDDYNDKFEHGSALVDDDFKDKSVDFLEAKRKEFINKLKTFNDEAKSHIKTNLNLAREKKRNKKTALILSIPIIGCFGVHKFYLGENGNGILFLLFSWTIIPAIASLFNFISILTMTEEKFDTKYNPVLTYYSQFSFEN